ncbi:GMC oxidoreductase, partial [Sphaerobolus stellatus SS14]
FHYVCTCRMAPLEEDEVVDDELMVWGADGLRVADTSVFPGIITGHTMGPPV